MSHGEPCPEFQECHRDDFVLGRIMGGRGSPIRTSGVGDESAETGREKNVLDTNGMSNSSVRGQDRTTTPGDCSDLNTPLTHVMLAGGLTFSFSQVGLV